MNLAVINTRGQDGVYGPKVMVEVDLLRGMPNFSIVGLPETVIRESKERIRSALINSGFKFPIRKITVNLAPADLPKTGGRFDLPIALGILAASNQISLEKIDQFEFAGELALCGNLRPITGVIPLAIGTKNAKKNLCIPLKNAEEASLIKNLPILAVSNISEICAYLNGSCEIHFFESSFAKDITEESSLQKDLADIKGQEYAKYGLEIAAGGGHSILFIGPPGAGKTMLANRITTIMDEMDENSAIEVAAIRSISKFKFERLKWRIPPYRAPHHTASSVALVGGGNPPRPGEISLAHKGVLFLDEFPEFNRHVLNALREPLESQKITISRAGYQNEFPADFQLLAAMNPCPCGYFNDFEQTCKCSRDQIKRYLNKISGPILDHLDMLIEVPRVKSELLLNRSSNEPISREIKNRVLRAQQRQIARANKLNCRLINSELDHFVKLNKKRHQILEEAIKKLKLSARSYYKILRVSLTIADLKDEDKVNSSHITYALNFCRFSSIFDL